MSRQTERAVPRMVVSSRRNCPVALAVFLAAYAGILVVVFAPEGTFVSPPTSIQSGR